MDGGEVRIMKSKDGQMDTTPSCVAYNKKRVQFTGMKAFMALESEMKNALLHWQREGDVMPRNAFAEFKRTMGTTEEYTSSFMERGYSSEELSSEVLKKLRSNVDDEEFTAAVITVPAMFDQPQIYATQRAAELAGFQYCELLQEPIAASIAYGMSGKGSDGYWLVFDFGGGTFDAALMRVEEGIIKVVDTSGDNHLGGKNLDYAVVDEILIPHLAEEYSLDDLLDDKDGHSQLRDTLKPTAEQIKKDLSSQKEAKASTDEDDLGKDDSGTEMELDLTVTTEQFELAVGPIIQRAIDISLAMLKRNHLAGNDLNSVLLVGGPTFLPTLRGMIKSQITDKVNFSIDPMTAVAVGAALYASTKDIPKDLVVRDFGQVQLVLKYPETTVETEERLGIRVDRSTSPTTAPTKLFVELKRRDGAWGSGRVELEGDAEILDLGLLPGKANGFTIYLFDEKGNAWPCEPNTFSIIQGFKPPEATLPCYLCIHAFESMRKKELVIPIDGLQKNVTLPARGKVQARTQMDLHPNKPGEIKLLIYGTQDPYSRAFPAELADSFVIKASALPQFLAADSPVHVTVEMDASRRISVKAYFPSFDEELDAENEVTTSAIGADDLSRDLRRANSTLAMLQQGPGPKGVLSELKKELDQVEGDLENGGDSGDTRLHVASRLATVWKQLDDLGSANEWPTAEAELREAYEEVLEKQERLGTEETAKAVTAVGPVVEEVIRRKDLMSAKKLTEQLWGLRFALLREHTGYWISILQNMDENFNQITWKSPGLARQILAEAKQHVNGTPTRARVEEFVRKLWDLQPDSQEKLMEEVNKKLLRI
jgi:molecular chaperone DnaK